MIPQKVTIDSALRIFQYKILTNTLYLNKRISKFNTDSAIALRLKNLWESLRERLSPQFPLPELSPTLFILGNWNDKKTPIILY